MIDPLYWFLFAGLFSPGPNVILLSASGAQFGARATWPHIGGVVVGVGVLGGLIGFGIGALLLQFPVVALGLKLISAAWILWMAYRLLRGGNVSGVGEDKPFTLLQAALFQWVNPKVWAVGLAGAAGFSLGLPPLSEALRLASAFAGINFFVCVFWVYFGQLLGTLLRSARSWLIFRTVMAVLLALSASVVFL